MASILQITPIGLGLQNVAEASATCLPRGLPSSRRSPPLSCNPAPIQEVHTSRRYRTTLVLLPEHLLASAGVPTICTRTKMNRILQVFSWCFEVLCLRFEAPSEKGIASIAGGGPLF